MKGINNSDVVSSCTMYMLQVLGFGNIEYSWCGINFKSYNFNRLVQQNNKIGKKKDRKWMENEK